ncbi:DUF1353 domain-containing protein [Methylosinus sp. Ce-a6]|uniref:DUF1353 domain-containing protein n=1 Tax=Methylosinus sp. Ce-a6 TaxID=2172005 RepID=UPI00135AD055|nr:DUF1353 domain-containing protein [Methylosinus sp. Ce-a6]
MKRYLIFVAMVASLLSASAQAEFIGELAFTPAGCEKTGLCIIKSDFRYKDPNGLEWLTKTGDKTDGASIPPWAQPFVGQPFEKQFLKAAVIHDHYCDRHVRPWRQTHRVFYDALVESGLDIAKAKLMYYAVYLGGPKWVELIPGKPCGGNCIFKYKNDALVGGPGSANVEMARASQYDDPNFIAELKEAENLIAASGNKISLDDLERRAKEKKPADFYYLHGDTAEIDGVIQ